MKLDFLSVASRGTHTQTQTYTSVLSLYHLIESGFLFYLFFYLNMNPEIPNSKVIFCHNERHPKQRIFIKGII